MRKLFKQITAVAMSATMIIGAAGVTSAAVAQGTNVSQNEWIHILFIQEKTMVNGKTS